MESKTSTPKPGASTPSRKAQLESMSHDDLVQHCLKHIVLLQKLKGRYDQSQETAAKTNAEQNKKIEELTSKLQDEEKLKSAAELISLQKKLSSTRDELECTNMKLETLMSSLKCVQQERDELSVERENLSSKSKGLADELSIIYREKQDLVDRVSDGKQQISGLKNHIKTMAQSLTSIKNLEKENVNLRNEVSALNITVSTLKESSKKSLNNPDAQKLEATVSDLKNKLELSSVANSKLKQEVSSFESIQSEQSSQMQALQDEIMQKNEVVSELEEKLGVPLKDVDEFKHKIGAQVEKLHSELQKMKETTASVELEKGQWEKKFIEVKSANTHLVEKISVLEKQNETLSTEVNNHKAENASLQEKLVMSEEQLSSTNDAGEEAQKELEENVRRLEDHNASLQRDLADASTKHNALLDDFRKMEENLQTSLKSIEEHNASLKQDLAEGSTKYDALLNDFNQMEGDLQISLKSLEDQNNNLKQDLINATTKYDALSVELMQMREKQEMSLNTLEEKNLNLQKDLDDAAKKYESLSSEFMQMQENLCMSLKSILQEEFEQQLGGGNSSSSWQMVCEQNKKIMGELNDNVRRLKHENSDLVKRLEEAKHQEELSDQQSKIQSDATSKKLEEDYSKLMQQYDDIKTKYQDACDQNKKMQDLVSNLESLERGKADLADKLLEAEQKHEALLANGKQLLVLEKDNTTLLQEKSELIASLEKSSLKVAELEERLEELKAALQQKTGGIELLNEEIEGMRGKCSAIAQEKIQIQEKGEEAVSLLETNLSISRGEVEEKSKEIALLHEKLENLKKELERMRSQDKTENLAEEKLKLEEQLERLSLLLSQSRDDNDDLQLKYENALSEHKKWSEAKKKTQEEIASQLTLSQQKCNELATLVDTLQASEKESVAKCIKFSENLTRLEDDKLEQQEFILKVQEENKDLLKNIQDLQDVRANLEVLSSENENLKKNNCEFEDRTKTLQDELEAMKENLVKEKGIAEQNDEEKILLKEESEGYKVECETLKAKLTESMELCGNLEMKIEQLTVEINICKTKLESEEKQTSQSSCGDQDPNEHEKALKAKDEYSNKLKMIAVKAKKELELTKKSLKAAEGENSSLTTKINNLTSQLQGSQTQAANIQMMQLECDKLQDQLDQSIEEKKTIEKNLEDVVLQLKIFQAEKDEVESELSQSKERYEQLSVEKADMTKLLTMTKATVEMLESERNRQTSEISSLKEEVESFKEQTISLEEQLAKEKDSLQDTKHHLSEAKKGIKQSDMLALEMAQYERTVSELQEKVVQLESALNTEEEKTEGLSERLVKLQEDRMAVEKLRLEAEDRANQANQAFISCKEEIRKLQSETDELRNRLQEATTQVQDSQQETERHKLQLANSSSDIRLLQERIVSMESSHARNSDILERKLKALQADCDLLGSEKDSLSSEYENYKIRVHTVLKQQKSKDQEQEKKSANEEQITLLKTTIEELKLKVYEAQNTVQVQENELHLVNADYERVIRQHEQDNERASERENRWKGRMKGLQLELSTLQKQHSELTSQYRRMNESLLSTHKHEMQVLKDSHKHNVDQLTQKFEAEYELLRSQNAGSPAPNSGTVFDATRKVTSTPHKTAPKPSSPLHSPSISMMPYTDQGHYHSRHSSHGQMLDLRSVTREDGEGQENPDECKTFEQILGSSEIKAVSVISDTTANSELRQRNIEERYEAQARKLDHLSEVVRENEATVSRLTEQNRVLKEEIRRLEKNQERETSVANMEYLKNVLYKFITLPPCDEKKHLLPVMDTMLKFDPKEKAVLLDMTTDDAGAQGQKGWSGYFQRWSGLQ